MNRPKEPTPASVPQARQAGSCQDPWSWTEPAVWTERMLTALQKGVKGGIWFSLIDKVYSLRNLTAGFARVQDNGGAAGVDRVSVERFAEHLESNLKKLAEALRQGSYQPQAVRRVYIPKPDGSQRPLGIPTVGDRVIQAAVRHVLEPIFERDFAEHSYGFRPGRSCKDALRRVNALLQTGYRYVVDADLKSYFDTIPHERLLNRIRAKVADGRVLQLLEQLLQQKVLDELQEWTPEQGTPQGSALSPLMANIYLDPLDHLLAERDLALVRYADDLVILCRTPEEAQRALALVQQWTSENGLTLHPSKTRIVDIQQEGFDFLGYHFQRTSKRITRWPRKKSLAKLKASLRTKTKRTDGRSLGCIITEVNRVLQGWFEYFQHSLKRSLAEVDGWVRMRLRSILRKRRKRRGRGRGADHQRWPNAYFAECGLYSLAAAHAQVSQSRVG